MAGAGSLPLLYFQFLCEFPDLFTQPRDFVLSIGELPLGSFNLIKCL